MMSDLSRRHFGSRQTAFLLLLASAAFWLFVGQLPIEPVLASDSASYLDFSPVRPHGYSLFLAGYRWIWGNFAYLPATQAAIYIASIAFLSIAVGRRLNSLPAGIGLFLLLYAYLVPGDIWSVVSEPLYAGAATAACAALVFYMIRSSPAVLIAASALLGIAIVCRTIGYALVPAFLLSIVWHSRPRGESLVRTCVLAVLPIGIISGVAATSNLLHNGSFSIGSWGGVSLLGKGLVLARPLPASDRLAQLNWTSDVARPVREALAQIHNPILETLVVRQYYEYLRWWIAWPAFERTWRAWRIGDETERERLARHLATAYVLEDVPEYLRLVGLDYLSLWTLPRYLTASEQHRLQVELAAAGPLPLLTTFAETREGEQEYYQIIPAAKDALFVYGTRAIVAAFWAITIVTAWLLMRHCRFVVRGLTDLLFMVIALHSVYISTALVEAGLERYTWPTWPMLVAAPLMGAGLVVRAKTQLDSKAGKTVP
jgi:hypothetical protein